MAGQYVVVSLRLVVGCCVLAAARRADRHACRCGLHPSFLLFHLEINVFLCVPPFPVSPFFPAARNGKVFPASF